ncbi:odorant receptor 13a-like [Anticarsia gemmatalis]|uniref:odorant receptor 13a-like n=1 Tax=Anticarsia gemmatalis TaxID=129554 RepID=UPI003F75AFB7
MNLSSCWPGEELGEKVTQFKRYWPYGMLTLCSFYFFGGVVYLILYSHELAFYEISHAYICVFMALVCVTRLIFCALSKKYNEVVSQFVKEIHLFYYKDKSESAMETYKKVHKLSHLYAVFLLGQMTVGLIFFNMIPVVNNYADGKFKDKHNLNGTYEHAINLYLPFDAYTNFSGYIFFNICNWLCSYICSSWFCFIDLILSITIFHICGHFNILLDELASFPLPSKASEISVVLADRTATIETRMYSDDELKLVSKKLKECIEYHRFITVYTNKVSDAFGPVLLSYYMFHQVSLCLLLLQCSQMTTKALICYGPLTFVLFQELIQLSVIIELIGTMSEKLIDSVYWVPWEYMDVSNKKTVAIYLLNVQKVIRIKALGMAEVGVTTMASIIKTSLSYFAFLRSVE